MAREILYYDYSRVVVVGFENPRDRTPPKLPEAVPRIITVCMDWDPKGRHSAEHDAGVECTTTLTAAQAQAIVQFLKPHMDRECSVLVYCERGLWRSGAVAEHLRKRGAQESRSQRLLYYPRPFNVHMLELLDASS